MSIPESATDLTHLEPFFCLSALAVIVARPRAFEYRFLIAFLATRLVSSGLESLLLRPGIFHLSLQFAYKIYFYSYWVSYAVEAILGIGIAMDIFQSAMEPLKGLRDLGMMMFRWAGAISIVVSLSISFGPRETGVRFMMHAISQLQRTQSVLTLCMLLFVCFAIHPMGLSVRSRIFGVSLGLGILAATDLVQAAWIQMPASTVYSSYSLVNAAATTVALLAWIAYFAFPEPRRRMVLLPTTSPFFRWNRISEALGDTPGYVALGQVPADMFAPAEVEVMRRAAAKMDKAAGM